VGVSEKEQLDETDIYEVLSSERRRIAIDYLRNNPNPVDVNELAENVAAEEQGESPPPKDARKAVYVSLHQTHLPKLDELNIAEYDTENKQVSLSESFRDVAIYMEVVPSQGLELSWSEYYLAIGLIGLATAFATITDAPLVSGFSATNWLVFYTVVLTLSALYQTITRRSL